MTFAPLSVEPARGLEAPTTSRPGSGSPPVAAAIVVTGASSGPGVSDAAARRQGVPRSIVVRDVKSFVEGARGLPGTRTLRFQGARAFRFPDARAFMFPGAPPS